MYIPAAFVETDATTLHDFIEMHSFGLLVSHGNEPPRAGHHSAIDSGQPTTGNHSSHHAPRDESTIDSGQPMAGNIDRLPFASHLPFLLDRTAGPHGTLIGHMARANQQWRQAADQTVLAVFSGPHAYISPTWYAAEQVVPTWNYVAVHVYGRLRVIEERHVLLDIVRETLRHYEQHMARPWSFDAESTFIERLLSQIVGFRIEIERIEGKWKLNQNHPSQRRERVIQALRERGGENAEAIANLMQATIG